MSVNSNNTIGAENVQSNTEPNLSANKDSPSVDQNNPIIGSTSNQGGEILSEDPNWKAVREARKQERKDREAAERKAKEEKERADAMAAALEAVLNKPQNRRDDNPYHTESWGQSEETEEQRIERKVNETLAKKEAEYAQQRAQREAQEYPQRLQREHNDFLQTIAEENLDYLEYHYPEVAGPLNTMPQGYDRWNAIYKAVKRFVPNTNSKKDAQKAENNFNKPKSMSTVQVTERGDNPFPTRIDQSKKAENWERMQRTMNKLG